MEGQIAPKDGETADKPKLSYPHIFLHIVNFYLVPIAIIVSLAVASGQTKVSSTNPVPVQTGNATCQDVYNYTSVNGSMKIWLAMLPFVLVMWGILGLNVSSKVVAPATLIATIFIGLNYFFDEGWAVGRDNVTVSGLVLLSVVDRVVWTVFEYAFNVYTAFLFLRVVQIWGVVESMREEFERLAVTPPRKVLLVLFCFAIMVAVVAPGGSNFLIAGAIMIDMNIMKLPRGPEKDKFDLRIGAICLFGNALTSAFNLVGVCIIAIAGDNVPLLQELGIGQCFGDEVCAQKEIGGSFSVQFAILSIISPFIMVWLFDRAIPTKEVVKKEFPLLFLCGGAYALIQWVTALYVGPELPCLTAAGAATLVYIFWVELVEPHYAKLVGYEYQKLPPPTRKGFKGRRYMIPFILLVALLMIIRLVPGLESALNGDSSSIHDVLSPVVFDVDAVCVAYKRRFSWLSHSGMQVLLCALLTPFLVPYRLANVKIMELVELEKDNAAIVDDGAVDASTEEEAGTTDKQALRGKLRLRNVASKVIRANKVVAQFKQRRPKFYERYITTINRAFWDSLYESIPVMVSIGCYASIAVLMSSFQMTQTIALAIVDALSGAPIAFTLFVPVIGMLGSGLTGSTTTSNFLFGRLQIQTAIDLGLVTPTKGNIYAVAAAQILGATAGEMIAPMNAVFSTLLLGGRFPDSHLIKLVLPLFFPWLVVCMLTSLVALGA